MKATIANRTAGAFTILELLCVIAIIAILAAILLPAVGQAKARAKRLACIEQMHQTGIAFISFAHDHDGKFPMAVPSNAGGSLEFAQPAYGAAFDTSSFRHLQTLADELRTPRMVVCPSDTRAPATNFIVLQNQNVSYFVGLNAALNLPNSILEGDRNLTNDYTGASSVLHLGPGAGLRWTHELHLYKGNLLFADGRVEESNTPRAAGGGIQMAGTDLSMPTVLPPQRPVGGTPATTPSAPPAVASVRQAGTPDAPPWMPRSIETTTPMKPNGLVPAANQPTQPLDVAPKIADTSSNPSAWLLPKKQAPDPGFSLFPQSMSLLPKALVRKSVWPLWLLLVLLLAGLLTRFKWLGNRD